VTKETKPESEARIVELAQDTDLIVLARYMQILTGDFLSACPAPVINIHHSFLPASSVPTPTSGPRNAV